MPPDIDQNETYREMCLALVSLMVKMGLFASVMPQYPEHVQENFRERMEEVTASAKQESEEILQFGESFDEEA